MPRVQVRQLRTCKQAVLEGWVQALHDNVVAEAEAGGGGQGGGGGGEIRGGERDLRRSDRTSHAEGVWTWIK